MKTVKKNVYYCDHCEKRLLSAGHMIRHEKHCTANPDRECRLCNMIHGGYSGFKEVVEQLKKRYELVEEMKYTEHGEPYGEITKVKWIGEPVTLKEIRDAVENCPNCILAILRQCKFTWYFFYDLIEKFEYKKELDAAMAEYNSLQREEQYGY